MNEPFKIFTITEEDVLKINSLPNEPHHHDFEELILGIEGELEHFIDFKTTHFESPFVSFVTKGKVHRVKPCTKSGKSKLWVLRFKSEFIPETTFQLYSFYHDHANLKMQPGQCFQRMITLCELIHAETLHPTPDYAVIRHLLSALFTMIESERKKQMPEETSLMKNQNTTFRNFLNILEENFRRSEGVEFYAEKLFMSVRNLNLICQSILQKSVSELIETRKLIEAKNLLMNTDMAISEIGYELGYNEKAYFSNVFKKKSGQTPTEFRDDMRKYVS